MEQINTDTKKNNEEIFDNQQSYSSYLHIISEFESQLDVELF